MRVLAGAALGGIAMARFGLGGPLVFGAIILALTNLSFAGLAMLGDNIPFLVLTICADNLAQWFHRQPCLSPTCPALPNVVIYSHPVRVVYVPDGCCQGKFLSGFSGIVVDAVGWVTFFVYASLMGLPAILLAVLISRGLRSNPHG